MLRSIRFPVGFADVLPHGFFAQSVEPVTEFDPNRARGAEPRQEIDKDTGLPLWVVAGVDGDVEAVSRRQSEVRVKIPSAIAPELPPPGPGFPFPPIELAGLTMTPYLDRARCRNRDSVSAPCKSRIAYAFRATAMRPAGRAGSGRTGSTGASGSAAPAA
jgi:hypothetical protein